MNHSCEKSGGTRNKKYLRLGGLDKVFCASGHKRSPLRSKTPPQHWAGSSTGVGWGSRHDQCFVFREQRKGLLIIGFQITVQGAETPPDDISPPSPPGTIHSHNPTLTESNHPQSNRTTAKGDIVEREVDVRHGFPATHCPQ